MGRSISSRVFSRNSGSPSPGSCCPAAGLATCVTRVEPADGVRHHDDGNRSALLLGCEPGRRWVVELNEMKRTELQEFLNDPAGAIDVVRSGAGIAIVDDRGELAELVPKRLDEAVKSRTIDERIESLV